MGDSSSDDDSLSNVELVHQDIENMAQASTPSPKDLQVSQIEPVQPSSENENTTTALSEMREGTRLLWLLQSLYHSSSGAISVYLVSNPRDTVH
jgi:hypothetical protein